VKDKSLNLCAVPDLFKKLPYKIKTRIESDMLILRCNFDEEN